MKRRAKQSEIVEPNKSKKKSKYSDDDLLQSKSINKKKNGNKFINSNNEKCDKSNGKVEKITTVVSDIPSYRVCWAQIYSFPYWPCKVKSYLFVLMIPPTLL